MAQRDPVLVANTREWLRRAADVGTAAFLLTAPSPFVRSAVFHCQQAVEKAMKALLTWHDVPFRMTHNLVELGDSCTSSEPSLGSEVATVTVLTKYAARFRYPGAPYEPTLQEAHEALRLARGFTGAVAAKLAPRLIPSGS